jgi:hypothetical protein
MALPRGETWQEDENFRKSRDLDHLRTAQLLCRTISERSIV